MLQAVTTRLRSLPSNQLINYLLLSFFLVLGSYLRIKNLDLQSLWYDELFSVIHSSLPSLSDTYRSFWEETNPPLHGLILHSWIQIFSNSVHSVRGLSVLFGIINLSYLGYIAYKEKSQRYVYSFILFSVSFGAIYYSQEARAYSLLMLLSSILTIYFLKLLSFSKEEDRRESVKNWSVFLITGTLASYTHYFGFLFLGHLYLLMTVHFIISKKNKELIVTLLLGALQILLFSPELYKIAFILPYSTRINWVPETGVFVYFEILNYTFYLMPYKGLPIVVLVPVAFLAYLLFQSKHFKTFFSAKENSKLSMEAVYLFSLIVLFLTSTALVSIYKPILTGRNLLVLSFPAILLVSLLIESAKILRPTNKLVIVSCFAVFFASSISKGYYKPFKMHYKQSLVMIMTEAKEGEKVYSHSFQEFYDYYPSVLENPKQIHVENFPKKNGNFDWKKLDELKPKERIFLIDAEIHGTFQKKELSEIKKRVSRMDTIPVFGINIFILTK
ncbi:glycosyltransferase family 39 protein [Leptospira idonii]|uniref:Uncharacterized protein n=1 Tax=Leptospira idonii TaxID=1193500 RepID=A0A4R9LY95_9LEPT|nr:glycosyltransferase family 39 protein [Leptospira idonii]TGN18317.1 hypothetical protein EHS15_13000 [Leptospira idonii]